VYREIAAGDGPLKSRSRSEAAVTSAPGQATRTATAAAGGAVTSDCMIFSPRAPTQAPKTPTPAPSCWYRHRRWHHRRRCDPAGSDAPLVTTSKTAPTSHHRPHHDLPPSLRQRHHSAALRAVTPPPLNTQEPARRSTPSGWAVDPRTTAPEDQSPPNTTESRASNIPRQHSNWDKTLPLHTHTDFTYPGGNHPTLRTDRADPTFHKN